MDAQEALKKIDELEKIPLSGPKTEPESDTRRSLVEKILSQTLTEKDVPQEMYQAFIRSVLTNVPFSYSFTIMKGELTVTFTEPKGAMAKQYSKLRSSLGVSQMETVSQLAILSHLGSITSKKLASPLYVRPEDVLNDCVALETEAVEDKIGSVYTDFISERGESLSRIIPSLWLILSGLWNFMLQKEIPQDF